MNEQAQLFAPYVQEHRALTCILLTSEAGQYANLTTGLSEWEHTACNALLASLRSQMAAAIERFNLRDRDGEPLDGETLISRGFEIDEAQTDNFVITNGTVLIKDEDEGGPFTREQVSEFIDYVEEGDGKPYINS